MEEISVNTLKKIVIKNHVKVITKSRVEIYFSAGQQNNHFYMEGVNAHSVELDCSILFQFNGEYDIISWRIIKLLLSGSVLNPTFFASLLKDEKFTDFTFIAQGEEIKVHKCLISAASEVLETMLTCGLDETKNNSTNVDYDPKVFRHFINYIYTNTVPIDEMPSICFELYKIAHINTMALLEKICLVFIDAKKIDRGNALELYEFAITYKNETLQDKYWEFIKT